MAASNPYQALFDGIAARLIGVDQPFTKAAQIEVWPEAATADLVPDERMEAALSKGPVQALLCYAGGEPGQEIGGAGEFSKVVRISVIIGVRAPGADYSKPLIGDGTNGYWGLLEVLFRAEKRLCRYQIANVTADEIAYAGDSAMPSNTPGLLIHKLAISAPFIILTGD